MNVEIHKKSQATQDVRIDISEVFPPSYKEAQAVDICETEARAVFEALKAGLPEATKSALLRLIQYGGLAS